MADGGTRRRLTWSLVGVNVVMVLTFVGAAGSTSQARRALDGASQQACVSRAGTALRGPAQLGEPRFVGADTIAFRATPLEGGAVTVTCTFEEPDPDQDGALVVREVEVTP